MTMYNINEIERECINYNNIYYYSPYRLTKKEQKEIIQEYKENEEKEKKGESTIINWDYLKIDFLLDKEKFKRCLKEKYDNDKFSMTEYELNDYYK